MKFMPISKISAKMPWTGQVPGLYVRLLGVLDLLAAAGLVLPVLLHKNPKITIWTAIATVAYMICAMAFHISRGEKSVVGVNIIAAIIAGFIAYGMM